MVFVLLLDSHHAKFITISVEVTIHLPFLLFSLLSFDSSSIFSLSDHVHTHEPIRM